MKSYAAYPIGEGKKLKLIASPIYLCLIDTSGVISLFFVDVAQRWNWYW
jgi:hypothetical protein